jgi:hypothetical protein
MITRSSGFFFFARLRTVHRLAWLLLCALLPAQEACLNTPPSYQETPQLHQVLPLDPLTPEEKQTAERVALGDPRVKGLLSAQHKPIYVEFLAMKPDDEAKTREAWPRPIQIGRYADVVFYRDNDDFGFRVIVNLEGREVNHVERIDREQVPVPPQDFGGHSRSK